MNRKLKKIFSPQKSRKLSLLLLVELDQMPAGLSLEVVGLIPEATTPQKPKSVGSKGLITLIEPIYYWLLASQYYKKKTLAKAVNSNRQKQTTTYKSGEKETSVQKGRPLGDRSTTWTSQEGFQIKPVGFCRICKQQQKRPTYGQRFFNPKIINQQAMQAS